MGLFDLLKTGSSKNPKCAYCKEEKNDLPLNKKFPEGIKHFCSKECSTNFRKERKKKAKKGPQNSGSGLPW